MDWIQKGRQGVLIRIRVQPRAGRSGLQGPVGGRLKVRVHAAPQGGAANEEILSLFSRLLRVAKTDLEILRGQKSRQKDLLVAGPLSVEEVRVRLEMATEHSDGGNL